MINMSAAWWQIALLIIVAGATTMALVPLAEKLAWRLDAIDYPSARRINTEPTPRLGGVAIFAGLLVALLFEFLGEWLWGWQGFTRSMGQLEINYAGFVGGLLFMFAVGLVDDIRGLKPLPKLIGQIIAALIIAFSGVLLQAIRNPLDIGFLNFNGVAAIAITVAYLVLFANMANLIDGLDGMAAGVLGISALALMVIALMKGRVETALLTALFLGSCLGFLRWNFNPAKVFMGDSGALTLGMLLGSLSLIGVMRTPTVLVTMVPLLVAGVALVDVIWSTIRRLLLRKPVGQADTYHIHHMLMRKGFSQRRSVLLVWAWTIILAALGVALSSTSGLLMWGIIIAALLVSALFVWRIGLIEPVLRHVFNNREKPEKHEGILDEAKKNDK